MGDYMKNGQNSWVSEYQRKKFLERHKKPFRDFSPDYLDTSVLKIPTIVAVMLDLDGTVDFLDDEKAFMFHRRVEYIRQKFDADTAFISISTHYSDTIKMKKVLAILSRNLLPNIKIGMSFYYGGTYDYDSDRAFPCSLGFNSDKARTFNSYYRSTLGQCNRWIAIIDDGIDEDVYMQYQDSQPMLLAIPSSDERVVSKNNFMRRASTAKGFNGVLEIMDGYIEDIKDMSFSEVLKTQREMITHLSSYELVEKIRRRDYAFLERYFKEGYADDADYEDTLSWLLLTNSDACPSKEELIYLRNILDNILSHFQLSKEEQGVKSVFQLKKVFGLTEN